MRRNGSGMFVGAVFVLVESGVKDAVSLIIKDVKFHVAARMVT
jgi:hypothetical protein